METVVDAARTWATKKDTLFSVAIPNVIVLSTVKVGVAVLTATLWMALELVLNQRMYTAPL